MGRRVCQYPSGPQRGKADCFQLQAFFLVLDDLMDKSLTRRGQPCYYRVPEVGTIAVNDAVLIESALYTLLKLHFRNETYYIDLVELFHEVISTLSTLYCD